MYIYKEKHFSSSLFSKSDIVSVDKSTYSAEFKWGRFFAGYLCERDFPSLSTNNR